MRVLAEMVGSRREFFRAGARYTLLGLLTAASYLFAARKGLKDQHCINLGICSGCGQFSRCALPSALSAKQTKGAP